MLISEFLDEGRRFIQIKSVLLEKKNKCFYWLVSLSRYDYKFTTTYICGESWVYNVAVVFDSLPLPKTWKGFKVVGGDDDDLRFLDKPGTVIGLYAKGRAKKDKTGFVVPVRRLSLNLVS